MGTYENNYFCGNILHLHLEFWDNFSYNDFADKNLTRQRIPAGLPHQEEQIHF